MALVPLAVRHCVDEQLPQRERLASCNAPPDHRVIQHGSLARKEDVFHAAAPMRNYAREYARQQQTTRRMLQPARVPFALS